MREKGKKRKRDKRKNQVQRRRRYSAVKRTYALLSQRTKAHEGPMLEALARITAHRSPASQQVLLIRFCGQQMSPHWSQYYSKLQFRASIFITKWKEILL